MNETVRVRVTDGDVWVDGEHHSRGDEVDVPRGVYERIPESFEPLGGSESAAAEAPAPWDKDEWLDGGYQNRADLVRTGAVDEFLDEVEACETSETVLDAVTARREELEG